MTPVRRWLWACAALLGASACNSLDAAHSGGSAGAAATAGAAGQTVCETLDQAASAKLFAVITTNRSCVLDTDCINVEVGSDCFDTAKA